MAADHPRFDPVKTDHGWALENRDGARLASFTFGRKQDAQALARKLRDFDALTLPPAEARLVPGLRDEIEDLARDMPSFRDVVWPQRPRGRWSGESYGADYDAKRRATQAQQT